MLASELAARVAVTLQAERKRCNDRAKKKSETDKLVMKLLKKKERYLTELIEKGRTMTENDKAKASRYANAFFEEIDAKIARAESEMEAARTKAAEGGTDEGTADYYDDDEDIDILLEM